MNQSPPANAHSSFNYLVNALRDPNYRSWILINPTSIGDTWTVCALAHEFKKTHGGMLTMVIPDYQTPIAMMYRNSIDRIIPVDKAVLSGLCLRSHTLSYFGIDQPFVAHPFFQGDGRTTSLMNLFALPGRGGVFFADIYRYMLHLDWDTPLSLPTIPNDWRDEALNYAMSVGIEPGRSVILFPDNNTAKPLPQEFWQRLVCALKDEGWKVFTNMAGNSSGPRSLLFDGSYPINLSIKLAIPLAELAGYFISGSNGLAALLIGSEAKCKHSWIVANYEDLSEIQKNDPANLYISQQAKYLGFTKKGLDEYAVNPDRDMGDIIGIIARSKKPL